MLAASCHPWLICYKNTYYCCRIRLSLPVVATSEIVTYHTLTNFLSRVHLLITHPHLAICQFTCFQRFFFSRHPLTSLLQKSITTHLSCSHKVIELQHLMWEGSELKKIGLIMLTVTKKNFLKLTAFNSLTVEWVIVWDWKQTEALPITRAIIHLKALEITEQVDKLVNTDFLEKCWHYVKTNFIPIMWNFLFWSKFYILNECLQQTNELAFLFYYFWSWLFNRVKISKMNTF